MLLRLKAFDPDRLFNRLIGKVRFFFTRPFLVASAALIAVAFGTTFLHWHEIGQDVLRLYRVETFILAWFVILLVGITHEFAQSQGIMDGVAFGVVIEVDITLSAFFGSGG